MKSLSPACRSEDPELMLLCAEGQQPEATPSMMERLTPLPLMELTVMVQ